MGDGCWALGAGVRVVEGNDALTMATSMKAAGSLRNVVLLRWGDFKSLSVQPFSKVFKGMVPRVVIL
uniref:Uncharacterized protein n=1 Tax=Vespula pensylvanica TaxID=30213 RepID=A0A834P8P7_VESPE|nr:hypothetical protein H0235_005130 [Vespula pensylvanica]